MTPQEEAAEIQDVWARRDRVVLRRMQGFSDIGALWHSVSCLCEQCMDMDATAISAFPDVLEHERLFAE